MKEAKDVINKEINYIESQAADLQATTIGKHIKIRHILLPTMVEQHLNLD